MTGKACAGTLFQEPRLRHRGWGRLEAAYGVPAFGERFTSSTHIRLGLALGTRDYSVGWRLRPEEASTLDLSFGLKASRRESDGSAPEHTVELEAVTIRW